MVYRTGTCGDCGGRGGPIKDGRCVDRADCSARKSITGKLGRSWPPAPRAEVTIGSGLHYRAESLVNVPVSFRAMTDRFSASLKEASDEMLSLAKAAKPARLAGPCRGCGSTARTAGACSHCGRRAA